MSGASPIEPFVLGRRPALDGLRAIAVLAVVLLHADFPFVEGGFLGVDVFFVLSGFLITTLLLEEFAQRGQINLKAFYVRRARRLMPAFLVFLAIAFVITYPGLNGPDRHSLIAGSLTSLLYVRNWFQIASKTTLDGYTHAHLWSLAVEEQFYFVWPIVVLFLTRLRHRAMMAVTVVALGSSTLASILLSNGEVDQPRVYLAADTRAAQLLAGALLAMIVIRSSKVRTVLARFARVGLPVTLLAIAFLMLSVRVVGERRFFAVYNQGGIALFGLLVALMVGFVLFATPGPITRILSSRPFVAVGRYSYAIYLWHVLAINLFSPSNRFGLSVLAIDSVGVRTIFVLASSIGIAALSMRLVEKPIQMRLFPSANLQKRTVPPVKVTGPLAEATTDRRS